MKDNPVKKLVEIAAVVVIFSLSGCAGRMSFMDRISAADRIAGKAGFNNSLVKTDSFTLKAYHRIEKPGRPLTVYIEGDGHAWVSRKRLSRNPTPRDSLVLDLAAMDPSDNVVYIARPCQYVFPDLEPLYDSSYWSEKRFSEIVISAMDQAIDKFKGNAGAEKINLIGYSGGAAVAVLIAARRQDVASLRTVAGNLNHEEVTRYHRTSPLKGSLNPIDVAPSLARLPQRHFVGEKDRVVPPFIARSFARRLGDNRCIQITEVKGGTHKTGWRKYWRGLLAMPVVCIKD